MSSEAFLDPVELVGGPLDGELLETSGWTDQERAGGVALPATGAVDLVARRG